MEMGLAAQGATRGIRFRRQGLSPHPPLAQRAQVEITLRHGFGGEPYVYVAGQVTLDAPDLAERLAWLMYAENSGQFDFGDGDRAGLALLGTGKCVPQL